MLDDAGLQTKNACDPEDTADILTSIVEPACDACALSGVLTGGSCGLVLQDKRGEMTLIAGAFVVHDAPPETSVRR